jgi:hypothetical protein
MLASNVRVALRSLRKRPAFTGMAILILALGIGANTAIFGVVNAVLLASLPYGDPASLITVFADGAARGQGPRLPTTGADFAWWEERAGSFSGLAALHNESRRLTSVETPLVPLTHAVTANYFDVLGSRPELGRDSWPGKTSPAVTTWWCSAMASGKAPSAATPGSWARRSSWTASRTPWSV